MPFLFLWIIPVRSGLEVIQPFSCSTLLSMKFILLINVKMPTFVGILTFMSWINTASESFKTRYIIIFQHFSFNKQWIFHDQLSLACKTFITLRPEIRMSAYKNSITRYLGTYCKQVFVCFLITWSHIWKWYNNIYHMMSRLGVK